jgi:hypothetical protein
MLQRRRVLQAQPNSSDVHAEQDWGSLAEALHDIGFHETVALLTQPSNAW